ncbi:hypothetical protein Dimus_038056 [Dionaea muscipula]
MSKPQQIKKLIFITNSSKPLKSKLQSRNQWRRLLIRAYRSQSRARSVGIHGDRRNPRWFSTLPSFPASRFFPRGLAGVHSLLSVFGRPSPASKPSTPSTDLLGDGGRSRAAASKREGRKTEEEKNRGGEAIVQSGCVRGERG